MLVFPITADTSTFMHAGAYVHAIILCFLTPLHKPDALFFLGAYFVMHSHHECARMEVLDLKMQFTFYKPAFMYGLTWNFF